MQRAAMFLATLLSAEAALAAPTPADKATAQTLYDDGMKLIAKKDYAPACKKLEESDRLDPGMGTKYRLAECYEHLGRTASAWVLFREVADEAKASAQADREKKARDRANKLEPKLSRLTITVGDQTKGLEVKRDGAAIGEGQFGAAVAVDPGSHTVEATAPGKKPFQKTIDVAAGAQDSVVVTALEDLPAETQKPETPPASSSTWQKPAAYVAAGVGVVALGVSTALILSARSSMKDAEPHCVGNACDAEGTSLRDTAVSRGNLSTVFFVVGVIGVAGGAALYLTAPSDTTPRVGIRPGFITLEGRF